MRTSGIQDLIDSLLLYLMILTVNIQKKGLSLQGKGQGDPLVQAILPQTLKIKQSLTTNMQSIYYFW